MADDFFDSLNPKDLDDLRRILAELEPDDEPDLRPDLVQRLADVLRDGLGQALDNCPCAGCRYRRHELPEIETAQHEKINEALGNMLRRGLADPYGLGQFIITIYAIGVDNARRELGHGQKSAA